jgi:hypothetical protein
VGEGPAGDPTLFRVNSGGIPRNPVDAIDYYAYNHDIAYFKREIAGRKGVFSDMAIVPDMDLISGANKVIRSARIEGYGIRSFDNMPFYVTPRSVNLARAVKTGFTATLSTRTIPFIPRLLD